MRTLIMLSAFMIALAAGWFAGTGYVADYHLMRTDTPPILPLDISTDEDLFFYATLGAGSALVVLVPVVALIWVFVKIFDRIVRRPRRAIAGMSTPAVILVAIVMLVIAYIAGFAREASTPHECARPITRFAA